MTTNEILTALKAIEDKLTRTPTAFRWTPAMSAIWPKDYRPTMTGLLAMWDAMHEAAEYGESKPDYAGWMNNDFWSSPQFLRENDRVDIETRSGNFTYGVNGKNVSWQIMVRGSDVVRWRLAK